MHRTTFLTISLLLAIALTAKVHATEPTVDLQTTAVKIMLKAFQVGDYETVETLFDKLTRENKEKFLHEATEMADFVLKLMVDIDPDEAAKTILDNVFLFSFNTLAEQGEVDEIYEMFGEYTDSKVEQTQLLGRLAVSLLTQQPELPVAITYAEETTGIPAAKLPEDFTCTFIPPLDVIVIDTDGSQLERFRGMIQQLEKEFEKDQSDCSHAASNVTIGLSAPRSKERAKGEPITKMYYIGDIIDMILDGDGGIVLHHPTRSLAVRHTDEVHAQFEGSINRIRQILDNEAAKKIERLAEQPKFSTGIEFVR